MRFVQRIENIVLGPPTHATVLYRDGRPVGIAGLSRERRAEAQATEVNDELYYANMRGDDAYRGATYAGSVLITELDSDQQKHLPK